MSADLHWLLTRNTSAFVVKRNGVVLSREPGNLTSKHSFKQSGLVNARAVGVLPAPGKKGVVVVTKKKGAKGVGIVAVPIVGKTSRATTAAVKHITAQYRPDLQAAALGRVTAILKSQRPVKAVQPKKTRGAKARV